MYLIKQPHDSSLQSNLSSIFYDYGILGDYWLIDEDLKPLQHTQMQVQIQAYDELIKKVINQSLIVIDTPMASIDIQIKTIHLPHHHQSKSQAPLFLCFISADCILNDLQKQNLEKNLQQELEKVLKKTQIDIAFAYRFRNSHRSVQVGQKPLKNIKNIIAIMSGKGGVGKSTVAANLALSLKHIHPALKIGLVDADIYGPSVPTILGVEDHVLKIENQQMQAVQKYGIMANSMGFLVHEAAVWRGPMASQALQQLILQTNWGDLDFLIVDMPPGTGDISLTLAQKIPITGCVVVTTPQNIATMDADKCLNMAQKLNLDVLGIVENMSVHICSNCQHNSYIFGYEGGVLLAEKYKIPTLAQLPLLLDIAKATDLGEPLVFNDTVIAKKYHELAAAVTQKIAEKKRDSSHLFNIKTI